MNLRTWFADFTAQTGETPTHIVIGVDPTRTWNEAGEPDPAWGNIRPNEPVAWADIDPVTLDHDFDDGYGGDESPNFCAWSDSWVIFSDTYDGAENAQWVPRHPTAHTPIRPGGG